MTACRHKENRVSDRDKVIHDNLTRLKAIGIGCGPGCSCAYRLAAGITKERLAELEVMHVQFTQILEEAAGIPDAQVTIELQAGEGYRKRPGIFAGLHALLTPTHAAS